MPDIKYLYKTLPGKTFLRPLAVCGATNLRNGLFWGFVALVDTGAQRTSISEEILEPLGIDRRELVQKNISGVGGECDAWICDYIKISFLETLNAREGYVREHFPNNKHPVPMRFTEGSVSLLGQDSFLDLCVLNFNGPKRETIISF